MVVDVMVDVMSCGMNCTMDRKWVMGLNQRYIVDISPWVCT